MRTLNGCRVCLIACLALSFAECRHDDETSSVSAEKTQEQREATSASITTIYSGGGVTIQRVLDDDNGYMLGYGLDGALDIRGNLLSILKSVAPEKFRNEAAFPKGGYAVCVERPKREMNQEELRKRAWGLIVPAYEKAFHVSIHQVSRTEEVFVLQIRDQGLCNVEKAKDSDGGGWGTSHNGYEFRKQSFTELSEFLAEKLGVLVLDETRDRAIYTFEVPIDIFDAANANVWIVGLKKVGLELRKMNRKIQFTLIEETPATSQSAPHH